METFNSLSNTAIVVYPGNTINSAAAREFADELQGLWGVVKTTVLEAGHDAPWTDNKDLYYQQGIQPAYTVIPGYSNPLIETVFPNAIKLAVRGELLVESKNEEKALEFLTPTDSDLADPRFVVLAHSEVPFGQDFANQIRARYSELLCRKQKAPTIVSPFMIAMTETPNTVYGSLTETLQVPSVRDTIKTGMVYKFK